MAVKTDGTLPSGTGIRMTAEKTEDTSALTNPTLPRFFIEQYYVFRL